MDRKDAKFREDQEGDLLKGIGVSHGAFSVINAMAAGIGCTVGTELITEAEFKVEGNERIVNIISDPGESTEMAKICVSKACSAICANEPEGWVLTVESDIPISRGMKSSSSACNAIISSVLDCYGKEMDTLEMIRLGVECAKEAGVTVTGSFDDACGCHIGGLVMTDNKTNTILFQSDIREMDVIFYIPSDKIRKGSLPLDAIRATASEVRQLTEVAKTDPLKAMILNGSIFSKATGVDNSIAEKAMEKGALAAGITGSGPAIAIIAEKDEGMDLALSLGLEDFIFTHTRGRQQ